MATTACVDPRALLNLLSGTNLRSNLRAVSRGVKRAGMRANSGAVQFNLHRKAAKNAKDSWGAVYGHSGGKPLEQRIQKFLLAFNPKSETSIQNIPSLHFNQQLILLLCEYS